MTVLPLNRRIDARLVPMYARDWRETEPVRRWRERVSPNTFPTCFGYLYRFLKGVGKDPETAILWARETPDKYQVLDAIQNYVIRMDGRRYQTKECAYAALRSYFIHNRVMLPRDPSFQIRSDQPPVERKLTIDNLRELVGLATQPFRSMIMLKWMGLLDNEVADTMSVYTCPECDERSRSMVEQRPKVVVQALLIHFNKLLLSWH